MTCHYIIDFISAMYVLYPKTIVLLPGFFLSQNDCPVSAQLEIEVQSQLFLHKTFYIKKSFDTATSGDVSDPLLCLF